MASREITRRLERLEDRHRDHEPMRGFYIITEARAGDTAEHERQAAEKLAAIGYIEGHPLVHIRGTIAEEEALP